MEMEVTADIRDVQIIPANELAEIAQNVQMIIATGKFSVPMDRNFGISVSVLDQPIATAQARLSAEIATAVREQEPRAVVKKVFYEGNPLDGQLKIRVRFAVVENKLRGGV